MIKKAKMCQPTGLAVGIDIGIDHGDHGGGGDRDCDTFGEATEAGSLRWQNGKGNGV